MATVHFKGTSASTAGELPALGSQAPSFELSQTDLSRINLESFKGKKLILNIFPSVDTGTCAQSVRTFNHEAAELDTTAVLCISKDLPFAQNRFCGAEGIENVIMLSDYMNDNFGKDYGIRFIDGPFEGLLARAVVVIDKEGKTVHSELVSNISDEPNYKAALEALYNG
ncbi:thiol peroxidase [Muriicola soli]|uniref:Thiol peroxidase n=1 Tax=Muriicola soli TaxID=2507538 RepID=A0A411E9A9_9FLAO|nr:thiol peroxidase [Muriicola soli]QBA64050.1 thiol peroxidase [Muriicola soli]